MQKCHAHSGQPASFGRVGHKSLAGEGRHTTSRSSSTSYAGLHGGGNAAWWPGIELAVRVAGGLQTNRGAQGRYATSVQGELGYQIQRAIPRMK